MARPYKYVCKYYSKNNGAHYTVHSNALGVLKEGFWVTEEGELVVKHSAPEFKNINLESKIKELRIWFTLLSIFILSLTIIIIYIIIKFNLIKFI